MATNKTNNCLSEESLNLTFEESRENSCSLTSRKALISFRQKPDTVQRITCKIRKASAWQAGRQRK